MEWQGIAVTLVNVGFSGVVAWFLLTRGLPTIQDRFSQDLREQRADFQAILAHIRDDAKETMLLGLDKRLEKLAHLEAQVGKISVDLTSGRLVQEEMLQLIRRMVERQATSRSSK